MVGLKKRTGDPTCPFYICEAKRSSYMIKEQAHSLAIVDKDGVESDHER
jgi:hypothetical protein